MNNNRKSPCRYKVKGGIWKCKNTLAWGYESASYETTYSLLENACWDVPLLEEDNLILSEGKYGYRMELADDTVFTVPCIYDEIVCIGDNINHEFVLGVRKGALWGIYNGSNLEVDCIYDAIGPIGRWFYCPICRNGKWGVFAIAGSGEDKGKGEIVPCIYDGMDTCEMFTNKAYMGVFTSHAPLTTYLRVMLDGKVGVLDDLGEVAVPAKYDFSLPLS